MALFGKASWYSALEHVTSSQLFADDFVPKWNCNLVDNFILDYNINCFVKWENSYHYKFGFIKNPPSVVYMMGEKNLLQKSFLGVVGPRLMTLYGRKIVETFFDKVQDFDLVIVSGGAEGVDILAHKLAIAKWLPTLVVLGWWLAWYMQDPFYRDFFEEVLEAGGAVLSEFKLFQAPTSYSFPQRNRIIAGLADCLFIPEAKEKSGSLITADFAIVMNKPIYVTPWDFFSQTSRGVHRLVSQKNATLVDSWFSFLDTFFTKNIKSWDVKWLSFQELEPFDKKILDYLLQSWGWGIQELADAWFSQIDCYEALIRLEMAGLIRSVEFGKYVVS